MMRFGLSNAPSTFQATINHIFRAILDNIFYAKNPKCEYGRSTLSYLGHIVSPDGVSVDPNKVRVFQEWLLLKNVKQLQGFLRFAGYYTRFVAHYATLVAPLIKLLSKDAYVWTQSATVAFNDLKNGLMHTPVLALPDFSNNFLIQTDASGLGVGVVLSQTGHPITYFSNKMSLRL
ncbi:retrovirus-related pol polyprotein from transposon 297 family protein [Tanacetum coccineum]